MKKTVFWNKGCFFDGRDFTAYLYEIDFQPPKIPPGTELVLIGYTSASLYKVTTIGYTIPYLVKWDKYDSWMAGWLRWDFTIKNDSKIGILGFEHDMWGYLKT